MKQHVMLSVKFVVRWSYIWFIKTMLLIMLILTGCAQMFSLKNILSQSYFSANSVIQFHNRNFTKHKTRTLTQGTLL